MREQLNVYVDGRGGWLADMLNREKRRKSVGIWEHWEILEGKKETRTHPERSLIQQRSTTQ